MNGIGHAHNTDVWTQGLNVGNALLAHTHVHFLRFGRRLLLCDNDLYGAAYL